MSTKQIKYPPEFKKKVCEIAYSESIINSAKYHNVNRKTVAKWIKAYRMDGIYGLSIRKKREDNQPTKLNGQLISKIIDYKERNPALSLNRIKEVFSLDCSLTLISSKLRKMYFWKSINNKKQDFYVTYGIMNDHISNERQTKKYRFELYDSFHGGTYYGFSEDCSVRNLCVFIKYVVACLEYAGLLKVSARIITNISYLLNSSVPYSDYDKLIRRCFGIEIFYRESIERHNSILKNDRDSICSVYRTSVLCNSEYYIPPFSIENLPRNINIHDTPGRGWLEAILNHKVANKLLIEAVKQIELFADQAKIDLDFDKALKFYGKIYQATVRCPESENIKINVLFKKAMIYYNIDSYRETKSALFEILELNQKCRKEFNIGQVHYYLGMIFKIENDRERSKVHFEKAVKLLYEGHVRKNLYDYFKALVNKAVNYGNYDTALKYSNKYLKISKNNCNTEENCKAFDMRGIIYFYLGKYYKSAKDFRLQLQLSKKNGLLEQEVKSLYNLLSVLSQYETSSKNEIEEIVSRLEYISGNIKNELLVHGCNNQLGNYYFRIGQYDKALDYYKNEVVFFKKLNAKYFYYRNLHYLALCNYYLGDLNTAIKFFFEICTDNNVSNYDIISHSYNFIGRIYESRNDLSKSLKYFKKSIKYARESNYGLMIADSLKSMGYAYKKNGNNEKALRYFVKALREYKRIKKYIGTHLYDENISFINKNMCDLHNSK